ncbi:unnamed protein product [Cladocopium goreaui]|uniref:Uncharacterized protein n=1 Tax=Cladocopium goreaui TaxID=2562237 RepID=A0A9P1DAG2_9DINO|nr:unnamed protein product [Cladocopium goreaui]
MAQWLSDSSQAVSFLLGSKSARDDEANSQVLCRSTQHLHHLRAFLEAVERNETGFENMIGRIRENWQCKLDTVIDVKQADFESPGCPDSEDFCLPMNGMQRSRACSLFRPSCQTYETKRCMLSL